MEALGIRDFLVVEVCRELFKVWEKFELSNFRLGMEIEFSLSSTGLKGPTLPFGDSASGVIVGG